MKRKLRVAILVSTNATSSQQLIDDIKAGKVNAKIVCFISDKEGCGALQRARDNNIEDIFIDPKDKTREEFDNELMKILQEKNIDLVLLIGYMRILSKEFVEKWGKKTMNIHPSLLPAFAGGMDKNVHEEVLKSGVKKTGCTLHFITEKPDEGPIVMQEEVEVAPDEIVESLKAKVQQKEKEIISKAVKSYSRGKLRDREIKR